jgi:DNA modification methylase
MNRVTRRQIETPSKLSNRAFETIPISTLRPAARNARTHSQKQIRQIAESIRTFGFIGTVKIDAQNRIIAGHGRVEAAKLVGLSEVPVTRISHLTPVQVRAFMIADNKLAANAGWDRELLRIELAELDAVLPDLGLDLSITGFESCEVDSLLVDTDRSDPAEDIPPLEKSQVARPGDLFVLGRHRLLVGDARARGSYEKLLLTEVARMAILDPPYNVKSQNIGGRGRIKHRDFVCASGELSKEAFSEFLKAGLGLCAEFSADGSIHYVFIDWRHIGELLSAGEAVYDELKNVCVWAKSVAAQGSFYRSQHELVFVFKHGTAPHVNTFELGQYGRTRSNVWPYAGMNSFRAGRLDELKMHPTVKPVALVADAMRDCSRRSDIVLDAFAGSGTTIIAAEQTGRRGFCMELDPLYADVCIRRWQAYTKRDAVLESTGHTFDELAASSPQGPNNSTTGPDASRSDAASSRLSKRARPSGAWNRPKRIPPNASSK